MNEEKQNFNGGYIKASLTAFDLLVELGYKPSGNYRNYINNWNYFIAFNDVVYFIATEATAEAMKTGDNIGEFYINNGKLSWEEPKEGILSQDEMTSMLEVANEPNPTIGKTPTVDTISISDGDKAEHFAKFGFEVPEFVNDYDYLLSLVDVNGNILGTVDGYASMWRKNGEHISVSHSWQRESKHDLIPIPQQPKEWWTPKEEEIYHLVQSYGVVRMVQSGGYTGYEDFGNCFKTKDQAELASKAMRRHNRLLKWVIDFQGDLEGKFYIEKDMGTWRNFTNSFKSYRPDAIMKKETAEALCKALNDGYFTLDSEV